METPVFEVDGGRFVATPLAAGPWDPGMLHGGPVAALLAHAMERHDPGSSEVAGELMLARVTAEILRPVPIGPVSVDVETVQAGRRTHRLLAVMTADGREVARATGLRVPVVPLDLPADLEMASFEAPPPGPDAPGEPPRFIRHGEAWGRAGGSDVDNWNSFMDACEYRVVDGTWDDPGGCTAWIKVVAPMIDEIGTTPLMRAVATADMSAGIGRVLPFDDYTHPNADLNVHVFRYPDGDWVGIRSLMWVADRGAAVGDGALYDPAGRFGSTTQACIVTKR